MSPALRAGGRRRRAIWLPRAVRPSSTTWPESRSVGTASLFDAGAKSQQPQTGWRSSQSVSNSSLCRNPCSAGKVQGIHWMTSIAPRADRSKYSNSPGLLSSSPQIPYYREQGNQRQRAASSAGESRTVRRNKLGASPDFRIRQPGRILGTDRLRSADASGSMADSNDGIYSDFLSAEFWHATGSIRLVT